MNTPAIPTQEKNAQAVNEPQQAIFKTLTELEEFAKTAPVTLTVLECPPLVDAEGNLLEGEENAPTEYMVGLGVVLPNGTLIGGVLAYGETYASVEEASKIAKALAEGDKALIDDSRILEYVISSHLIPHPPKLDIATASYIVELDGTIEIGDYAMNHLSTVVSSFSASFPDAIKAKQQFDIFDKNHQAFVAHREKRVAVEMAKVEEEIQINLAEAPETEPKA